MRALPRHPSAACHSQSTPPRSSQRSSSTAQIRSKTPRSIQRWKVRWTELSSGYSFGSQFHWQPVRSRKMTASNTPRWSTRLRPIRGAGSQPSRIGSMIAHSSSETRQIGGNGFRSFLGLPIACLRRRRAARSVPHLR